jgi:hypothetical protein
MIPSSGPTGSFCTTALAPEKVLIGWSAASVGPSVAKYSKIAWQNCASSTPSDAGFPISCVAILASSSARSANSAPILFTTSERSAIGTSFHLAYAVADVASMFSSSMSVAYSNVSMTAPVDGSVTW